MYNLLDKVNSPFDVKTMTTKQQIELAKEIREFLIENISKTGGHLASNLGIVELTIAIHDMFNMPEDKVIFDVGHQVYVHKIITGRKDKFDTLRQFGGLSGFPNPAESEFDIVQSGHSSTSISTALGLAKARDIQGKEGHVVAVIGDGALTGGMALEALDDAGESKTNLIVIVNDNEMSISENVGGISKAFGNLRTRKFYIKTRNPIKKFVRKIPKIGEPIYQFAHRFKQGLKQLVIPSMLFEELGFKYLGMVNGHDILKIKQILNLAKKQEGPVMIHVVTRKGKGYEPAEKSPDKFHSTSAFDIETGELLKKKVDDYSKIFGDYLTELAEKNKDIVAITAAMGDGTGLTEFSKRFPDRYFDVGIAEQHAMGLGAGLAKQGLKPFIPIYSSFLQRAYDQIVHDVAIQNAPVVICIDRAGVVGNDGATHQGLLDISFLSNIPNMCVLAPKDFAELKECMDFAIKYNKPIAIRYPRGGELKADIEIKDKVIEYGKSEKILDGEDITILSCGKFTYKAIRGGK